MSSNNKTYKWVLSAFFLAVALVLPFLTGQFQELGNKLLPMHLPVLLCGFICGPTYAAIIGFISPLLRFSLFGMPQVFPIGISMSFELLTYGLISGLLYQKIGNCKKNIYISLTSAMLLGRIVWGITQLVIYGIGENFGFKIFISSAFIQALPGIVIQLVLIPIIVNAYNTFRN